MKFNLFGLVVLISFNIWLQPVANAQIASDSSKQIVLNNFFGVYDLSKAPNGSSLLTSEETILADFPENADFYGLTRILPKTYQGHSVDIKVLSVVDAAGTAVPYKTKSDSKNNLVVTTGDPKVNLYGPQTIKLRYQTRGVINLNGKNNEFLLNTNGLGWSQPFGAVNAVVNIASNLNAQLVGSPSCYVNTGTTTNQNCSISTTQKQGTMKISANSSPVLANQALVVKMAFKPSTFKQYSSWSTRKILFFALPLLVISTLGSYIVLKRR